MTENFTEIYANITYNSYSIEITMYSILLSPAGGLALYRLLRIEIYVSPRQSHFNQTQEKKGKSKDTLFIEKFSNEYFIFSIRFVLCHNF